MLLRARTAFGKNSHRTKNLIPPKHLITSIITKITCDYRGNNIQQLPKEQNRYFFRLKRIPSTSLKRIFICCLREAAKKIFFSCPPPKALSTPLVAIGTFLFVKNKSKSSVFNCILFVNTSLSWSQDSVNDTLDPHYKRRGSHIICSMNH